METRTKNFILSMGCLFLAVCFILIISKPRENEPETTEVVSLPEKVVIIEKAPNQWCHYKVKRINEGVVTYIRARGVGRGNYSSGDTIYHKF
jgi:hypothetical protein